MTESAGGRRERRVNGEPRPCCCCCCCCCCCINPHSRPSCGLPGEEMSGENDWYPPPPPPLAGERKCNCCTSSSPGDEEIGGCKRFLIIDQLVGVERPEECGDEEGKDAFLL